MLVAKRSATQQTLKVELSDYNRITSTKTPLLSVTNFSASLQTWQSSYLRHMIAAIKYTNTGPSTSRTAGPRLSLRTRIRAFSHPWHQPGPTKVILEKASRSALMKCIIYSLIYVSTINIYWIIQVTCFDLLTGHHQASSRISRRCC